MNDMNMFDRFYEVDRILTENQEVEAYMIYNKLMECDQLNEKELSHLIDIGEKIFLKYESSIEAVDIGDAILIYVLESEHNNVVFDEDDVLKITMKDIEIAMYDNEIIKKKWRTPAVGSSVLRDSFANEFPNRDKRLTEAHEDDGLPYCTWVTVSYDSRKILYYHDEGNTWCYIAHIVDFDVVYPKEDK